MKRHSALYPLSWGHHHGLRWALHLKREVPGASPERAAAVATRLGEFWEVDLKAHFAVEEDLLLSRLGESPRERRAKERTQAEHGELEAGIADIGELKETDELARRLLDFAYLLDEHIHYEEELLFPLCEQVLGEAGLAELGRGLKASGVGQGGPVRPKT